MRLTVAPSSSTSPFLQPSRSLARVPSTGRRSGALPSTTTTTRHCTHAAFYLFLFAVKLRSAPQNVNLLPSVNKGVLLYISSFLLSSHHHLRKLEIGLRVNYRNNKDPPPPLHNSTLLRLSSSLLITGRGRLQNN